MFDLKKRYVIGFALSKAAETLTEGAWFEACHEFASAGTFRGELSLTAANFENIVRNFKNNIYKRSLNADGNTELHINYDHYYDGAKGYKAAGWITDVKIAPKLLDSGREVMALYFKPKWTAAAIDAIKNGEYKYHSIEFEPEYLDDQSGIITKDVLVGGALTNDPFVMNLEPVSLSTLIGLRLAAAEEARKQKNEILKKEEMRMKTLKEILKTAGKELSETATEEDAAVAIAEIISGAKTNKAEAEKANADVIAKDAELKVLKVEKEKTIADAAAEKLAVEEKAKVEKLAADEKVFAAKAEALKSQAIKAGKFSAAECAPEGKFGKYLTKEKIDVAEIYLTDAPVQFTVPAGSSEEGNVLTDSDLMKSMAVKWNYSVPDAWEIIKTLRATGKKVEDHVPVKK